MADLDLTIALRADLNVPGTLSVPVLWPLPARELLTAPERALDRYLSAGLIYVNDQLLVGHAFVSQLAALVGAALHLCFI